MDSEEEECFIRHCRDKNLEKVKDCLSSGVDVNTVCEEGVVSSENPGLKGGFLYILNS